MKYYQSPSIPVIHYLNLKYIGPNELYIVLAFIEHVFCISLLQLSTLAFIEDYSCSILSSDQCSL